MRPAPTSAIRVGSEAMRAQVLAVAALVGGGLPRVLGIRQDVLLDDQPTRIGDLIERAEHADDVDVAVAERAERLAAPDLLDGRGLRDDLLEAREAGVLEVHLVDPRRPVPDRRDRLTAAEQEVSGVQTKPNLGELQQALDLPLRLDVRGRVVMERRLVAALSTAAGRPCNAVGKALPAGAVEADTRIERRAPGVARPDRRARVGQGGA